MEGGVFPVLDNFSNSQRVKFSGESKKHSEGKQKRWFFIKGYTLLKIPTSGLWVYLKIGLQGRSGGLCFRVLVFELPSRSSTARPLKSDGWKTILLFGMV